MNAPLTAELARMRAAEILRLAEVERVRRSALARPGWRRALGFRMIRAGLRLAHRSGDAAPRKAYALLTGVD